MDHDVAYALASVPLGDLAKNFYAGADALDPGAGLIYRNVPFPVFSDDEGVFSTQCGLVYILSHECDIDPANARLFNDGVLVCPIIDLRHFVDTYLDEIGPVELASFLGHLGGRRISRVVFVPSCGADLPLGGLIYLNAIAGTPVSQLEKDRAGRVCAVTARGLRYIDQMLENHLLRPKAQRLALDSFREYK